MRAQKEDDHSDRTKQPPPAEHVASASAAQGVSIWLDDLSRKRIDVRQPRRADRRQARRRGHHQPVDLPGAPSPTAGLRAAARRARRARRRRRRGRPHDDHRRRPRRLRPLRARSTRPPAAVDGRVSIEVDPRLAHDTDGDHRRGQASWQAGRPAQRADQDPGDDGGPAGDHRGHRPRDQRQRHADLLPGPLPRGHGRLPRPAWRRPQAAATTCPQIHSVASFFVSRVDTEIDKRLDGDRHRRGARPQGQGGARQRPAGIPGATRSSSPATAGARSPPPAPTSSVRCGPRPA